MIRVQKGFSLIELLVSMAVGYFLITVLFSALWVVYNRLSVMREHNNCWAQLSVARDIMERDLKGIPCEYSQFKKIAADALIWPLGNGADRGYELEETVLKRIEGHYDVKTHQWHGAVRSPVINKVTRFTFDVERNSSLVSGIKISLAIENKKEEINDTFIIATRNRQVG